MIYKCSILDTEYYSVEIDLIDDLQKHSERMIRNSGFKCGSNEDWIRLYFNMQKRIISEIPRAVVKSREFLCPPAYEQALGEIENKITSGKSIIPYMSDKILDLKYKDLLLYDWNIYHLHLSRRRREDGFIKRSDYELFIYVTDSTAYFIQVYPHAKEYLYSTKEMVAIIHNNWPELVDRYRLKGVICCSEEITDEGHDMLRKNGISTFVDLGNETVYMSFGGGYATDGSSIEVTRNSDYWKSLMRQYEQLVVREAKGIINTMYKLQKFEINRNLVFKMICFKDDEVSLFEMSNGICIQLFKNENFYRMCYPQDLFKEEKKRFI